MTYMILMHLHWSLPVHRLHTPPTTLSCHHTPRTASSCHHTPLTVCSCYHTLLPALPVFQPSPATTLPSQPPPTTTPPSQPPVITTPPSQPSQPPATTTLSSQPVPATTPPSQPATVSFACRRSGLVEVNCQQAKETISCEDTTPDEQLDKFLENGCGCSSNCCRKFTREYYREKRDEANSLPREVLDAVVKGQVSAFILMDGMVGPSSKHAPKQRQITRILAFYHRCQKICQKTFLCLHAIGENY